MARNTRVTSDITVQYESGFVDMVQTYRYMLDDLHQKRFTKTLQNSLFSVVDRRFTAYMVANRDDYKHVFEWNSNKPLWIVEMAYDFAGYTFLPSTKLVPAKLPHTKYRHVFREKAQVMEDAPAVVIAPVKAKYLRWRGAEGEEVKSYKAIEVDAVAGGKYKNAFDTAFLLYWATGGDATAAELAHAVSSSPKFRMQVKQNKINGLKRAMTMQKKKSNTGSGKARALAKERMEEIIKEARQYGYEF